MASGTAADGVGAPEQEALVERRRRPEDKGKIRNFLGFLYNRETGKVLGRTGISWLEITVFYIIFYIGLAGFFAICLAVFVQTLDPKKPTWYGKGSIIGINPGMGYQPWLRKDPESTLIMFNSSNSTTYAKYTKQLSEFMKKYDNTNATRVCTGDMSNRDLDKDDPEDACRVVPSVDFPDCTEDNDWGYKEGKPCVAISINRLVGWEPVGYPDGSAPQNVKEGYDPESIKISCEGEYYSDQENMGQIKYMPAAGLPFKFYPYHVVNNYHQPIVMAQFLTPPKGILVEVECKAYAYNVIHDSGDRQGMVHFELLVDE